MGCFNLYCCICGNTYWSKHDDLKRSFLNKLNINSETIKKIAIDLEWINNCSLLLKNNNNIHNLKEKNCNNIFCNKNGECYEGDFYDLIFNYSDYKCNYKNCGIFIHTDCWKFIKINYGIELKYSNLPIKTTPYTTLSIDYGDIKKYQFQDMDYYNMYKDKNIYMIDNPLIKLNVKNIKRIKKIVGQLKLKKEIRPSPSISATFYKNNDIKIGNNNKFWIIKNNKWNEIKENIIMITCRIPQTEKNVIKQINKIPQIGEVNIVPFYVKNFTNDKKFIILKFIGTETYINEILIKLKKYII